MVVINVNLNVKNNVQIVNMENVMNVIHQVGKLIYKLIYVNQFKMI